MGAQLETFRTHYEELKGDQLRAKAWERFCASNTPLKGEYQPTSVPFTIAADQDLICLTLDEATKSYGAFLKGRMSRGLKEEKSPFAFLNQALSSSGSFLYIPPKTKSERVNISHTIDADLSAAFPRLQVFVGAHAEVTIHLHIEGKESSWTNAFTDIAVEEGAHVQIITTYGVGLIDDHLRATLKANSTLKSWGKGGHTIRRDLKCALLGENSEASLYGHWYLHEKESCKTDVLIEHIAPHCRSHQLFKGVLDDTSRSSFEGKIYVRDEAQKTDAFQLNNNLLLSDRASASSKPNLEIFADDVKASHGSTTGHFAEEELFYLRSRGISLAQAQRMLIDAFLKEVLPPNV